MAQAEATTSTTDGIWLREALALATEALGSEALAKQRLVEWLAVGELPWSCMSWEGLDAEGIAKLHQRHRELLLFVLTPCVAYYEGSPCSTK